MNVSELVHRMREGIQAEKRAVERQQGQLGRHGSIKVTDGVRRISEPGEYVYRFRLAFEGDLPEGTQVFLETVGQRSAGEIVAHNPDADWVECALRTDLGEELAEARLSVVNTALLDALDTHLQAIEAGVIGTTESVGGPPGKDLRRKAIRLLEGQAAQAEPLAVTCPGLRPGQLRAIGTGLAQEFTYLWGPPGTGKTQTVAHLTSELVERREKVLLVAHTNIAVDTALRRVLDLHPDLVSRTIRVGYTTEILDGLPVALDVVVDKELRRGVSAVAAAIEQLCERLSALFPRHQRTLGSRKAPLPRRLRVATELLGTLSSDKHTDLRQEAALLGQQVTAVAQRLIEGAALLGTSLTQCFVNPLLKHLVTDATILDEGSTASVTHSFVVGCVSRVRVIVAGDFMQLPPVLVSGDVTARDWLGRNVFQTAGCSVPQKDHPLRVMLDEQWRMHPQVSAVVSRSFYADRLRNAPGLPTLQSRDQAVVLLDTSRLNPRSESTETGSKRNIKHAELVRSLVEHALPGSIAVICPYRSQVRATRELLRESVPDALRDEQVEVFTAHRFQGREKDLVIFDSTEAPGTPCRFLDDLKNPDAVKLINVALSRAKNRLVIVGDFGHLFEKLGSNACLTGVLASAREMNALELEAGYAKDEEVLTAFLARNSTR
ncbi:MAG: AAA family ATPase [Candidatus Riflebacteria bacterium]|nr:AAA family ATPase [Candidatus Riflebacteria bacterium]